MEDFYYKDITIAVRKCKFRIQNYAENKTCWCCGNEFQDNEQCVLLISNFRYIPNMIVHKDCFDDCSPRDRIRMCAKVERKYQEYERLSKIFS
jgi:hypothetical protein